MEQLLGTTEIAGHPVGNLRTKTPKNEATTVPAGIKVRNTFDKEQSNVGNVPF